MVKTAQNGPEWEISRMIEFVKTSTRNGQKWSKWSETRKNGGTSQKSSKNDPKISLLTFLRFFHDKWLFLPYFTPNIAKIGVFIAIIRGFM